MDLRTLKYFVTVAEELNITRAAAILNMSQPPLSMQIKCLETELETELFVRGRRQLELTDSGKLLYRRAKEILNLTDKASSEIISMKKGMSGTISIGLVEGNAPQIVAGWIASFRKIHPLAKFRIYDGNSDELTEKLRTGLISLALISAPYDQQLLNSIHVGTEQMVAYIPVSHPLAENGSDYVTIDDLKGEPLIIPGRKSNQDTIYKWFKGIGSEPDIICQVDSYPHAVALAGLNAGISIFPGSAHTVSDKIVVKKIQTPNSENEYLFVWRKGRPLPTIEEAFIDFIKE